MSFENAISVCTLRPSVGVWSRLVLAVSFGFASALFAAEVTPTEAARAAQAWVDRGYAMGVFASERTVSGVDEIEDATTGARLHVVKFKGGGFVVLSADDLVDPVISFSATGDGIPTDDDNPFWDLLRGDIAAREAAAGVVRGAGTASGKRRSVSRASPASATSTAAQRKWSALLGGGTRLQSANGDGVSSLSDMRVAPLVQSRWGQGNVGGEPCFNYATTNNYLCGCVATAGAQIMRYFQWPAASMEMQPFTNPYCTISNAETVVKQNISLTTQAGFYNWANMPLNPTATISPVERQAIGKLTSDIGICCGMEYSEKGASIGSYMLAETFTNRFGYGSALAAQWQRTTDLSGTETLKKALLSNFDAGLPVVLSLKGVRVDHAIVSDGYGYSDGSLFIHLNFGWTGDSDAWYSPPHLYTGDDDDFNYNAINGFVFNILSNMPPNTVICSGRVLDADGNPVVGAVVSYCPAGSASSTTGGATSGGTSATGPVGQVLSDAKGIYALTLPPGRYKVYTSHGGSSTSGATSEALRYVTLSPNVATKTAYPGQYWQNPQPVINNLIEQDLVLSNLEGVAVPVFDPPSCLFYPTTNISITCATPSATIRYTLDGTDPTETSTIYTGPIAISDDVVITAKAWADGKNPSAILSAIYTYDASQGAPKGDSFADPIIISGTSGTRVVEDNSAYTVEPEEPLHTKWLDEVANMYYWYNQYNTIWYEWTAPGSGQMTFEAQFENDEYILWPMLAVYTGDSLSSIERIDFDNGEGTYGLATVVLNVQQGVTYRIVGMSIYEELYYGTFTLTWSGDLVVTPTAPPLEVTTSDLPTATTGVWYEVTLEATGGVAPYRWSAMTLPDGLELSSDGTLSGTPTAPGNESVPIYVLDSGGRDTMAVLNLKIVSPLEITTSDLSTATTGVWYEVTLEATGGVPPYRWSAMTLPDGLELSSDGTLSGRPTASGTTRVPIYVLDSEGHDTTAILNIRIVPPLEITTSDLSTATTGVWYEVTLEATGGVPPYRWSAMTLPDGLELSSGGTLSGRPTASGTTRVPIYVLDSEGHDATVILNLRIVQPLAITTSELPTATTGVWYEVRLEATGGVGPYEWSAPATMLPPGLSLSPEGILSGTPTESGDKRVPVSVFDSDGNYTMAILNLTIEQPPAPPVVSPSTDSVIDCESNTAAADLASRMNDDKAECFKAPEDAGLSGQTATDYANLFTASADGSRVVIELNETGTNTLETAATNVAAQVAANLSAVAATTSATNVTIAGAQPGFYYSVVYDDDLRTLGLTAEGEGQRELAGADGSVTLRIPQKEENATAGFYRVKVSVKAED